MATLVTHKTLSEADHSAQLRKAVIASTIGTAIEWYDFFLYGTAAGLIFGKLFFPNESALTATLAAFGTYFIGFVGRPIGAAIFGHYGDRIGRKATLIATLLCMGIATFLIAFVPPYESIGIWGAISQAEHNAGEYNRDDRVDHFAPPCQRRTGGEYRTQKARMRDQCPPWIKRAVFTPAALWRRAEDRHKARL